MKRRTFLKKAAGAAVAVGGAPAIIYATDKAASKNPIIGVGEHKYECIHGWGELPSTLSWWTTHGVTVDADGLVYIKHMGKVKDVMDTIVVFDADGKFVRSFGKEYCGGGHGIDVRKEGKEEFLYLSDIHNRQVVKTTLRGKVIWQMPYPKEAVLDGKPVYTKAEQYRPTNVAFGPDGGFYIADGYGSHYIHQYDKDVKYIRSWGGFGDAPGKMKTPHGIWLDNRPGRDVSLVVADRANARLQYFTLGGKHIGFVKDLLFPAHFDIRGEVLMVPDLHARVSLFDKSNKPIIHLGDDKEWIAQVKDPKAGIRKDPKRWLPGKFVHPHDACFDKDGNIFVVEWVEPGRVTLLKRV